MPELTDPPEAPEPGSARGVRPRDLVNHAVILQPTGVRTATDPKKNEVFEVVDCRFWRLESSGVAEEGNTGISWWRAREQLRNEIGQFIVCRPRQQEDNSIILERLSGAPRELAGKVIAGLAAPTPIEDEAPFDDDYSSDPF